MAKSISPKKVIFSFLCTIFFSVLTFGQSGDLQSDLSVSFKKFNLVRLNQQTALRQVEVRQSLTIPVDGRNYELELTPHDLRAANYRAEDVGASGVRSIEKGEITTFKGKIAGEADSEVRLTIDGAKIEGYFYTAGDKFFIEPAQNYSRTAGAEDFVVYREEDLLKNNSFVCDSELEGKIERGKEMITSQRLESASSLKVIELATEADFQFVTAMGNGTQANNEILSILNMVEGVYNTELNLSIRVVYQHTWSTPDPFDGTTTGTLLPSFQNYWNANLPQAQYPRDAAHLFTARANLSGLGIAYIGVVCRNPNAAYALSGRINSVPANNLVTAHEIAHNLGANHADASQSCASTIMNAFLSDTVPLSFCGYSRGEVVNYVSANSGCLSDRNTAPVCFDFDGDRKSDLAVFRPSNGVWYYIKSANDSFDYKQFGASTDKLVPADYDGDGRTDMAVYRSGNWYRLKSLTNTFDGVAFGVSTDIPAPADYDGDGKADLAVFRPADGIWHRLMSSNNAYSGVQFGSVGDVPMAADYDGDGKADINIFRPSTGAWYRLNSGNGAVFAVQFGGIGDKPLTADFDGDGKADVAVFRPSSGAWYRITSSNNQLGATFFGLPTDLPTPADYDGDGKTDVSVFRPSDGVWYRFNSSNGAFAAYQFGSAADVPISSLYNQ